MMATMGAFAVKHSPVLVGLLVGSAAKFGRMMALGQKIRTAQVVGHLLMMGMVGVAATFATDMAGISDPNARTFAAAVFAIAATDVIQWLASRAWKRFINEADARQAEQKELAVEHVFQEADLRRLADRVDAKLKDKK